MGLTLGILWYHLASKVARMTGLCHQAFHFNDCVYVVRFNCAYSCGVQRSTLMSSAICSILFVLKIGFPLNMVPTDFSYNGWPASPRHLPVCLPGDGITGGTQLFCVRWVNLPSLLMLNFKLRLETHTLVRLAALQLWAVWPTLHWCLILQSVWQAGTDSLRWRKHNSQTVFEP